MTAYTQDIVQKARLFRGQNLSFREIGRLMKIPPNTVRSWCFDMPIDRHNSLAINNEIRRRKIKHQDAATIPKLESLNKEQARFYASLLYGCEGAKYPGSNIVAFTNSDPYLICTFLALINRGYELNQTKFRIHLQIHNNQNFSELKFWWSNLLKIPESQFLKPTITAPKGKMKRVNYFGTCTLRYLDNKIQLQMLGTFELFVNYPIVGGVT